MQIYKHPDYELQIEKYQEWCDFCVGGSDVEKNYNYLPKHPYESKIQYDIRKSLATYKNNAMPIISVFNSSVWRKMPDRTTLIKELLAYENNVDNNGMSANAFFKKQTAQMASIGLSFIIVDSTSKPDGVEVKNKNDADKYNIRPYFTIIPAMNIINWGFNANNTGIEYVVIKEQVNKQVAPMEEKKTEEQYRIWYKDKWELWQKNEEVLILKAEGLHPCGEVPIVAGYFRKHKELVGISAIADVLSLLKRAYILENTLDKSLFDTAFPQQIFCGFEKDIIDEYVKASSNGLASPDPQAKSEFVEPSGRSFDALERKVKNDELSIREIALRMVRQDTKVAESADAKRIDQQQLFSQLLNFSYNCSEVENKCWYLFGKWLGLDIQEIDIKYNTDFDEQKINVEMLNSFHLMRQSGDISRHTLWDVMRDGEVMPQNFDAIEEDAKLKNETRTIEE